MGTALALGMPCTSTYEARQNLTPRSSSERRRPARSRALEAGERCPLLRLTRSAIGLSPDLPSRNLILKTRVHPIEQRLPLDEPLHVPEHEIERARRVLLFVVGRAMRRDDEIGNFPERRGTR